MNQNAELLNYVYQNSEMGVDTIEQLLSMTNDEEFANHLKDELREYQTIHMAAKEMLNKNGYDEKGIGSLDKVKTYFMINMQTMMDKTVSHIAKMMIIGSNMGIVEAIENLKKYSDSEKEILKLMERLLKFEEKNVEKLKEFL